MTNNLQPLYDILGEAFKAGQAYVQSECEERDISASWYLFPLAARMEAEIKRMVQEERMACLYLAEAERESHGSLNAGYRAAQHIAEDIANRSLPSSPERET
jgi:hypothetical protein